MRRASCLIRPQPHYRRAVFVAGLERCGYRVTFDEISDPRPGDVVVIWNRYGNAERSAQQFERKGAAVLCCENGFIGRDAEGHQLYSIARNVHNGGGTWHVGGPERWAALGVGLKPWRPGGEHVLVCPSRGFGPAGMAMPLGWEKEVVARLRKLTKRPIRVRPHPRDRVPPVPLAADLERCWAVVVWNSAAGVHALAAGVPVICDAPRWVLKEAAPTPLKGIEEPVLAERGPAFERLAWAQWTVEEIGRGEPFRHLLCAAGEAKVAAAA